MTKTIVNEGFTGLWVGFATYICRVSPHAITVNKLNNILRIVGMNEQKDKFCKGKRITLL